MSDMADPVQFYNDARTQQMTTLYKAIKVIAVFTNCRCSEIDLVLVIIYLSACGIVLSVLLILVWGFYRVLVLYIGHYCLSKNVIFVMY